MDTPAESPLPPALPTDLAAAHAMILAEREARIEAQAEALAAKAAASSTEMAIAHLKLMIEKLKRELLAALEVGQSVTLEDHIEPRKRQVGDSNITDQSYVPTKFERLSKPAKAAAKAA